MIARLSGKVIDSQTNHIVLDVNGVGYFIATRLTDQYTLGDMVSLYTHLAVRENALDLYGFPTEEAHAMFGHLIKLPKIGPKTAMQILSQADVSILKKAAGSNDPVYLSKISGISKKSAEKIVLGLKDIVEMTIEDDESKHYRNQDADVIDALITLGYSQKDAIDAVQKISPDVTGTNDRIKQALKYVG
jgi:holliday junction DNA helicase RuvA